jgi:hypothetical protein
MCGRAPPPWADGTFRTTAPPLVQLNEVHEARCFQTDRYSVGDHGLHAVTEQPRGDISLPRYLGYLDAAAQHVAEAAPADRDLRLIHYFNVRKLMSETIHRFFGEPGLKIVAAQVAGMAHQSAIAQLRMRLKDPSFATALNPVERAELKLLATVPEDFISCTARRRRA